MKPLAGKAVVITGAGGGLGAAYALHVANLGASVLVNDIDGDAAARLAGRIVGAGGKALACAGDVSEWSAGSMLVDACIDAFGTITGLVNNAGILRPALIEDMTEHELRRMLEINLMGTAACAQAAVRRMHQSGTAGSIVNVASGSQAGDVALGGYGATKGAVASLTYAWAMELSDGNIRMNAISPLAETAMAAQNAHLMSLQAKYRQVQYSALPPASASAPLVGYLLSDAASGIHGQVIRIAGRQLSLVSHPQIALPVLEDDWDHHAIAAAFDRTLGSRQHRLGLAVEKARPE